VGQVSVVTGGAGGMGLAAAKIIGRDRTVVIADVRQERLDIAAAELDAIGIACTAMSCDITDRTAVAQLASTATGLGIVTSVIHTAGVSPSMAPAEAITKINALGTVNVNEAFCKIAGPGLAIVNVASMAAHMMPPAIYPTRIFQTALSDQPAFLAKMMRTYRLAPARLRPGMAYSISKTFVRWYCSSQAARFGRSGVRILSVSPGSIDTEMGRLEESVGSGALAQRSALRRFGTAEEVAEVLAFCASDKASYLTGIDVLCDGGSVAALSFRDKLALGRKA
jgi:NAD(P)-dependent dehydrogenase (short-subunit alcohol dehydrogenase family)